MRVLRLAYCSLLLILAFGPAVTSAHPATSHPVVTGQLDLAAMALGPGDIPDGFFDTYDSWWVPAGAISAGVLNGAALPPGLQRAYQTFYATPEGATVIHIFLLEFARPAQATSGAAAVDAALRPAGLPDGRTIGPIHTEGSATGDGPHTLTAVTFDTRAVGGPLVDVVASSFRHDRLIAGVSIERYTVPHADATPAARKESAAVVSSPAAAPEQERLATDLAGTLESRIAAVQDGRAPAGVDFALSDAVLPLEQLVGTSTPVLGGYKAGIDMLRCGVCEEQNSLRRFEDVARGGYVRAVVLGPTVDGDPQPPFVAVAVTQFASPGDAREALAAMRRAPNDVATAYSVPRGSRTLATDPAIPGATAAAAFHGILNSEDPKATADSATVSFVVGDRLVTIDVKGGLASDEAMAVAVDLATQQAACLTAGGRCATVIPPEPLTGIGSQVPLVSPLHWSPIPVGAQFVVMRQAKRLPHDRCISRHDIAAMARLWYALVRCGAFV